MGSIEKLKEQNILAVSLHWQSQNIAYFKQLFFLMKRSQVLIFIAQIDLVKIAVILMLSLKWCCITNWVKQLFRNLKMNVEDVICPPAISLFAHDEGKIAFEILKSDTLVGKGTGIAWLKTLYRCYLYKIKITCYNSVIILRLVQFKA